MVPRRIYAPKIKVWCEKTRRCRTRDETDLSRKGDRVTIWSCRSLSKEKSHDIIVNFGDERRAGADERKIEVDLGES